MVHRRELTVSTRGRGTYDLTRQVRDIIAASNVTTGIATVFVHHTSASLMVCENADPAVRKDLEAFVARLVPDGDKLFTHTEEGDDDMPAHVRTILTETSMSLPIADGKLAFGVWQGLYLWEHRKAPHERKVSVTVMGD